MSAGYCGMCEPDGRVNCDECGGEGYFEYETDDGDWEEFTCATCEGDCTVACFYCDGVARDI